MTGLHETSTSRDANSREFHREQLSAMMDGALSADEARFLLRRMEHDDELADCWERWQFAGDAMRGHAGRALPADFSRRVGRAIATDLAVDEAVEEQQTFAVAAAPGARRPLLRWGGGAALAASVVLAALIGSRTLSSSEEAPPPAIAAAPAPIAPVAVAPVGSVPAPERVVPDGIAQAGAAAIVAATVASKDSRTRRPHLMASAQAVPVGRSTAAVRRASASSSSSQAAVQLAQATHGRDLAPHADMTVKPWPRVLVPGASAGGEVTAGFEGSPAFQPFQPPRPEWRPPTAASPVAAPSP